MKHTLIYTHALSPLHAGTGRGIGVIDLPIAREVATGLPFLPGSSLKGVLRDQCREFFGKQTCKKLFGPDTANAEEHASTLQFSDQRLLLMPVRSLAGTFAWVTSPFVLSRLRRELLIGNGGINVPDVPAVTDRKTAVTTKQKKIVFGQDQTKRIVLEDLLIEKAEEKADAWAKLLATTLFPHDTSWQTLLKERLCIVHDDVFTFLLDTSTEISARIKLNDDSKTVADGGLWYEEALPTESVLYGLVAAQKINSSGISDDQALIKLGELLQKTGLVQLGGSATVGRGLCQLVLHPQKEESHANS